MAYSLYRLDEFFSRTGRGAAFGKKNQFRFFNDYNVGGVLDK